MPAPCPTWSTPGATCSPAPGYASKPCKEVIQEHQLNRVVVASCSPRTHEPLFQETIHEVGLNPYLFELANIRDQCSWVHMQMPARGHRQGQGPGAHGRQPCGRTTGRCTASRCPSRTAPWSSAAASSGMTAALKMAGQGYDVYLVEREAELGGNARHIHSTLRNERCAGNAGRDDRAGVQPPAHHGLPATPRSSRSMALWAISAARWSIAATAAGRRKSTSTTA